MYFVKVYGRPRYNKKIIRYLVFKDYYTAADCVLCLKGRLQYAHEGPEDYFSIATIYRQRPKDMEQLGEAIEVDRFLIYLLKAVDKKAATRYNDNRK